MTNLKISQFVDGGAVDPADEIATNRGGINTKVRVGSAAARDIGSGPQDLSDNETMGENLAASLAGTSSTSNDIQLGTQNYITQPNKPFEIGRNILFVSASDPVNLRMNGVVTDWNPGTGALEVEIQKAVGTGNYDDWLLYVSGDLGPQGEKGWSPILAVVADPESAGTRYVLQVTSWTGGDGSMPATGQYIGPTGLVVDIGDAVDIRGPEGEKGDKGDPGDEGPPGTGTVNSVNGEYPDSSGDVTLLASNIPYNNATSGLAATQLQAAIDEIFIPRFATPATVSSGTHTCEFEDGDYHTVTSSGIFTLSFDIPPGQAIRVRGINFDNDTPVISGVDWGDAGEPAWTPTHDFIVYKDEDGDYIGINSVAGIT